MPPGCFSFYFIRSLISACVGLAVLLDLFPPCLVYLPQRTSPAAVAAAGAVVDAGVGVAAPAVSVASSPPAAATALACLPGCFCLLSVSSFLFFFQHCGEKYKRREERQ